MFRSLGSSSTTTNVTVYPDEKDRTAEFSGKYVGHTVKICPTHQSWYKKGYVLMRYVLWVIYVKWLGNRKAIEMSSTVSMVAKLQSRN